MGQDDASCSDDFAFTGAEEIRSLVRALLAHPIAHRESAENGKRLLTHLRSHYLLAHDEEVREYALALDEEVQEGNPGHEALIAVAARLLGNLVVGKLSRPQQTSGTTPLPVQS